MVTKWTAKIKQRYLIVEKSKNKGKNKPFALKSVEAKLSCTSVTDRKTQNMSEKTTALFLLDTQSIVTLDDAAKKLLPFRYCQTSSTTTDQHDSIFLQNDNLQQ